MGDLIDFNNWKKRKAAEAHAAEIEEIRALREELAEYIDGMEEMSHSPFLSPEDRASWTQRALDLVVTTLDGYSHWPIDSSDM